MGFLKKAAVGGVLMLGLFTYDTAEVSKLDKRARNLQNMARIWQSPAFWKEYENVWSERLEHRDELLDPRKAARRKESESYEQARRMLDATQPGDAAQIPGILEIAKKYRNDERMAESSVLALWHIGTPEAEQILRSMVTNPGEGELRLSLYAAGALGNISIYAARDAIIERGRNEMRAGRQLPANLKSVLYDIGDEASMEYFMEEGDADNIAGFVIRNEGKPFLYPNSLRAIEIIERVLVGVVYGGREVIDCRLRPDRIYMLGQAVNALDRTHAEKYLFGVVEASSCSSILAEPLRQNDFQ